MLDHESGFPVSVQKTRMGSGNVNDFTYSGLRRTEYSWPARQSEGKIRGQAGFTQSMIGLGSAKLPLWPKNLSLAQLTNL
jgi:hypothetical protein